jgi:hypothetical protein
MCVEISEQCQDRKRLMARIRSLTFPIASI